MSELVDLYSVVFKSENGQERIASGANDKFTSEPVTDDIEYARQIKKMLERNVEDVEFRIKHFQSVGYVD